MQTDRHGVVYRSERDHIYIYIFVWFCDVTFWGISRRQQRRELKKNKNTLCWLRSDSDDYIKQYLMLIKNYYYHHLVIPRTILPICTASHPAFIVHDEHFPLEDVSLSLSLSPRHNSPVLSYLTLAVILQVGVIHTLCMWLLRFVYLPQQFCLR